MYDSVCINHLTSSRLLSSNPIVWRLQHEKAPFCFDGVIHRHRELLVLSEIPNTTSASLPGPGSRPWRMVSNGKTLGKLPGDLFVQKIHFNLDMEDIIWVTISARGKCQKCPEKNETCITLGQVLLRRGIDALAATRSSGHRTQGGHCPPTWNYPDQWVAPIDPSQSVAICAETKVWAQFKSMIPSPWIIFEASYRTAAESTAPGCTVRTSHRGWTEFFLQPRSEFFAIIWPCWFMVIHHHPSSKMF